jgi:hypothetical protein
MGAALPDSRAAHSTEEEISLGYEMLDTALSHAEPGR